MPRIVADNVAVEFPVYNSDARSLKKTFVNLGTGGRISRDSRNRLIVNALDGVSFEIEPGDRVGLIGNNGAGKTTLLRVLAGIYAPVRGSVVTTAEVTPLFDPTLGMDMESTGYDNILMRGLFMGMPKDEMKARIPEISDFTELGDYLHLPVRTYSSGMMMRLAFGVSTVVQPKILLMDEWLSISDVHFREKAEKRLYEFVFASPILVIASHWKNVIDNLCTKVIYLEEGRLKAFGPKDEVLPMFFDTETD